MEEWSLLVGLGNPGAKYSETRHNAGFMLADRLARSWRVQWNSEKKFQALIAKAESGGKRVLLCQPQTFMNLSGEAVSVVASFYQLPAAKLLVAVDDADLPLGQIRLRSSGSSGGHHGLESIEQHLGTRDFARLRIGIGRQDSRREIAGHVLGKLSGLELAIMEKVLARAEEQVNCWLTHGLPKAMSQFNGVVADPNNEGTKQ